METQRPLNDNPKELKEASWRPRAEDCRRNGDITVVVVIASRWLFSCLILTAPIPARIEAARSAARTF